MVLFPGHTVSPLNISLQVLGGSAALLKCSFSFLRQTKITVSSCREKQPADSPLCTLQKQRPVMQSLLERGEKKNLGKLPMIQADSQFLMIQRKAFFNGLKKNSLWKVTDCWKQQGAPKASPHWDGQSRKRAANAAFVGRARPCWSTYEVSRAGWVFLPSPEPSLHLGPPSRQGLHKERTALPEM